MRRSTQALSQFEHPSLRQHQTERGNGADPPAEPPEGGQEVDPHLVSLGSRDSFEAEQYRTLRYVVELMHKDAGLRVVAVTSPLAGDGKTTTAINLAGSLAQDPETRVLLICADLRRPSLARRLGLARTHSLGLAELIVDMRRSLAEAVQRLPRFNLSIVPGGTTSIQTYEILKSPRVGDLLAEARQQYDYVILDTAPLVLLPDNRLIGQWVDGFLLVVAAHRTPRKSVEEALNLLDPVKVIGLVFNGDKQTSKYYAEYYGYRPSRRGYWHVGWHWLLTRLGNLLRG